MKERPASSPPELGHWRRRDPPTSEGLLPLSKERAGWTKAGGGRTRQAGGVAGGTQPGSPVPGMRRGMARWAQRGVGVEGLMGMVRE